MNRHNLDHDFGKKNGTDLGFFGLELVKIRFV